MLPIHVTVSSVSSGLSRQRALLSAFQTVLSTAEVFLELDIKGMTYESGDINQPGSQSDRKSAGTDFGKLRNTVKRDYALL